METPMMTFFLVVALGTLLVVALCGTKYLNDFRARAFLLLIAAVLFIFVALLVIGSFRFLL